MFPQKLFAIILLSLSIINYHNHDEIGSLFPHGHVALLGPRGVGLRPHGRQRSTAHALGQALGGLGGNAMHGKKTREKLGKMAIYWDFIVSLW